ncbi:MAG: M1 family metallopeptidase [Pseudomonadota bacterium]
MHRSLISAAIFAMIGLTAAHAAQAAPDRPGAPTASARTTTQLPRNAWPSHYRISLVPDAKAASFAAQVTITLTVTEPGDSLTLNAADLVFTGAALRGAGGRMLQKAAEIALDPAKQSVTFRFAAPLAKGQYQLTLDYTGKIGSQAEGLFALDYDTPQGSRRALYTQFENSDARRVVPSWDEPDYKASFALDVTVPGADTAVSNMPVASSTDLGDGRKRVQFATSPRMSTYLLFLGAGDFERATTMVDGTELGVIAKRGALEQARFALEASTHLLRQYNDYFGVRYPLPKLDNIAAPGRSQFFGAMENWGAIFSFEHVLLLDPAMSSQTDRENIYETLAHEMAHQWFGNLVTMRWWDDLWLNEGFASWMESRMTARLHPEWHTELGAIQVRELAMGRDSLTTTHPVVQRIATVEQASQAFDTITYQKGESVIRMLEAYVGAHAWRDGVRAYMRAHAYGNTVSNDLWSKIEHAAGKPITAIAHDFTLQQGVPMIRVGEPVCAGGKTKVALSQDEFTKDRPQKPALSWRVPVIAQVVGQAKPVPVRALVASGQATLSMPGCAPVLINAGQTGYYRTLYGPKNFAALASHFGRLAPIDQLGLMADSWSLGMAGLQPASDFLELSGAAGSATNPQVWGKISSVFGTINQMYRGEPTRRQAFADFGLARLRPVLAQVGWQARPGESAPVTNLREELIETMSDLGDRDVIAQARRRYAADASDPSAMPAALRKTILRVVARHADQATWDRLHAAAKAEKTPLVKNQLYDLLASSRDPALAQRALDLALTDEPGATNTPAMLSRVAHEHSDLAFDFAVAHLEQVNARIDFSSRSRYFASLAAASADPAMIDKLRVYAQANLPQGARGDAETAAADIAYRVQVRRERLPAIDSWLARTAR